LSGAADQHGVVLDILVQGRRDADAAKRFFKRLLRGLQYKPRRLVTDGLRTYGVAQRAIMPDVRHRMSRRLNNRAENSHRPTRDESGRCNGSSPRPKRSGFLSAHGMIYGHFPRRRHLMTAAGYRRTRARVFRVWRQEDVRPNEFLIPACSFAAIQRGPSSVNLAMPVLGLILGAAPRSRAGSQCAPPTAPGRVWVNADLSALALAIGQGMHPRPSQSGTARRRASQL
jgi:hypothetical protein